LTPRRSTPDSSNAPRGPAPSLHRQVKHLPYYSEKPERVTTANLNAEVPFADGPSPELKVKCRHFALGWLLQLDASGKPDYADFADEAAIQAHFSSALEGVFDHLQQTAPTRLVPLENWGGFLTAQLAGMNTAGPGGHARRFLLRSANHAMALELKAKPGPDAPRYVANFYDPNLTAAHKRVASESLAHFEALAFEDMLSDPAQMARYFAQEGESILAVVEMPAGGVEALPPLQRGGDPERRIEGRLPAPDGTTICQLMLADAPGSLRDIAPAFARLAQEDPERAAQALDARAPGGTVLCQLMEQGLLHTLRAYLELMDLVDLDPDYRAYLLEARQPDSTPAFFMALQEDQATMVPAFFDAVAASGLSLQMQVELLAAQTEDGDAGLVMAIAQGADAAALAYLEGLATHPGIDAQGKDTLLGLSRADGTSPMGCALASGSPDIVEALGSWIAGQQDISPDRRCELLIARDGDGVPGLVRAFERHAAGQVGAFVRAVLDSPMEDTDKVQVLLAGAAPGSLLRQARQQGAQDCVTAYRDAVLACRPAPAVELLLLSEVPRQRRSG
jgi:hypothetical protein